MTAALLLAGLAACSTPDISEPGAVQDAYEPLNREVHDFNTDIDRLFLRPAAKAYTAVLPDGVEDNIKNFADNLSEPRTILNQTLQGRPGDATRNLVRFGINSTLGIAGLADVAADLGLPREEADFGTTLAVWGVRQGDYLVLPVLGPSSERDTAGRIVDTIIAPLGGLFSPVIVLDTPVATAATTARVGSVLGQRGRFADTIDSLLYESIDPYTATRDVYLQNRAFELEKLGVGGAPEDDLYADIFGE